MNKSIRNFTRAILAALAVVIAGGVLGGGGATGTGYLALGRLTDFGSIFVNGIEFFTNTANISINGVQSRPESDLRVGMVLTVTGSLDGSGKTGTASSVVYQADALGLIDSAPVLDGTGGGQFDVLGQTISADGSTVFAGFLTLSDLRLGDFVEVSGFRNANGVFASRIERKSSGPTVQVQGVVANLAGNTFTIGSLTVDFTVAQINNLPPGGLQNGITVVASGPSPVNNVLQATSLQGASQNLQNVSNASLTGVVANLVPGSSMTVNGQFIAIASNTQFVNGNASNLANGAFVKVDVVIKSNTVVATKIEFTSLSGSPSTVESDVTATGPTSFELLGPGGVNITVDSKTNWQDKSNARVNPMSLAAVNVGDHMQVQGSQVSGNTLYGSRVVRTQPSTTIVANGRTLSTQAPNFTIFEVPFTTNASTDFRDENGTPITADNWFAEAAGHNVWVSAVRNPDGTLLAVSARLD